MKLMCIFHDMHVFFWTVNECQLYLIISTFIYRSTALLASNIIHVFYEVNIFAQ
jgi:hypothetical protein